MVDISEFVKEYEAVQGDRYAQRERLFELQRAAIKEHLEDRFPAICALSRCGLSFGLGWLELVIGVCEDLEQLKAKYPGFQVKFEQGKEKFGELRLYLNGWSEGAPDHPQGRPGRPMLLPEHQEAFSQACTIVDAATVKSTTICEICGEPGTLGGQGWIRTLCEAHR